MVSRPSIAVRHPANVSSRLASSSPTSTTGSTPPRDYVGVYDPILVATSVVIAILAAFVALSISGQDHRRRAIPARSRWARINAGAVVMGGGIWAMHFVGMLAFSLPCGTGYSPLGTWLQSTPRHPGERRRALGDQPAARSPSFCQLIIGAILMGAGIGAMHYSGMAAMEPDALLRYNPAWVASVGRRRGSAGALFRSASALRFARSRSLRAFPRRWQPPL